MKTIRFSHLQPPLHFSFQHSNFHKPNRPKFAKKHLPATMRAIGSIGQFGKLNFFNRWLTELRVKIFKDHRLNSLLGRDELGRDLLARLFWGHGFR